MKPNIALRLTHKNSCLFVISLCSGLYAQTLPTLVDASKWGGVTSPPPISSSSPPTAAEEQQRTLRSVKVDTHC